MLCSNDDQGQVSNETAGANSERLEARGVRTLVGEHPATPLYDARFERIAGVDAASKALAEELRSTDLVGLDGLFSASTDEMAVALTETPEMFSAILGVSADTRGFFKNQVRVMAAEHQDWANISIDFLDQ